MDTEFKQKMIEIEKERNKLRVSEFIYDMICLFSIAFTGIHVIDFVASFF
jgi:hypothetical protein